MAVAAIAASSIFFNTLEQAFIKVYYFPPSVFPLGCFAEFSFHHLRLCCYCLLWHMHSFVIIINPSMFKPWVKKGWKYYPCN